MGEDHRPPPAADHVDGHLHRAVVAPGHAIPLLTGKCVLEHGPARVWAGDMIIEYIRYRVPVERQAEFYTSTEVASTP
ncbi:hypothetical protein GCM10027452_16170 [Micromonospora halotolerans]